MEIATWNVNSVKAREDRLLSWLERHQPDVLCLQELKVTDDKFPVAELEAAGYYAAFHGQKTYNGVAIVSREPPRNVRMGMQDDEEDPQARIIAADVAGIRVISVYVPNGSTTDSDKFVYKLRWLERLMSYLDRYHSASEPLIVCGDLNIAPDERDVARPEQWNDSVLCVEPARQAYHALLEWGLSDCFRIHQSEGGLYSWWDYRMLGFPKNNGLRIDHLLATQPVAERSRNAYVDRDERKGKRPSDHAPVVVELSEP